MWTEKEYMDTFFEEDANEGMKYFVGDKVRHIESGQTCTIKDIDFYNCLYKVDINGIECSVSDEEITDEEISR